MKKKITIIGGGPSAFFLAAFLDSNVFETTIYEKNKSLGRKFLVAGKGGFNLSHSEDINDLVTRYTPSSFLKNALFEFDNTHLVNYLKKIKIPTYVGSSKRIFPKKGIKPIEVLHSILKELDKNNVNIKLLHKWTGWDKNSNVLFNFKHSVKSDYTIFSLGGASWKVTGSDGLWMDSFTEMGIDTVPFFPSNCAYQIDWSDVFLSMHEGKPLKNITISSAEKTQVGEVVITQFGLEGNAIYALSPEINAQLKEKNIAQIYLDFKPTLTADIVFKRLLSSKKKNRTEALKKDLKMSAAQIALLKSNLSKSEFIDSKTLAIKIKALPLTITSTAPIDEAISTTGGISLDELNSHYELKKLKGTYCIGEMLDWNAPTGGYLLQACFSIGVYVARHLNSLHSSN